MLQSGMLRYCGKALFANGLWAGIELDDAAGKNNGSVDGIPYFRCPPNYGIYFYVCVIETFEKSM